MGSGSTAVAAININRNFIGIEKEFKYYAIALNRLKVKVTVSIAT
ncbi:site-specific DNA-methyltransferase [Clostridium botulinum]|nr:DNA methyltransferase [Clostridium botulinum]MCR1129705.1 site-specific DNA-methyltransferase [Clostridium botulinum]